MAKAYKEYKVSELKAILSERSLATSGTKSELIARLEEHDNTQQGASEEAPDAAAEPDAAPAEAKPEPAAPAAAPSATPEMAPAAEQVSQEAAAVVGENASTAPQEPKLTPEQLTAQAIADLEKRIERKKRFGEDTAELEQQITRIKRFGYTPPPLKVNFTKGPGAFRNKRRFSRKSQLKVTK